MAADRKETEHRDDQLGLRRRQVADPVAVGELEEAVHDGRADDLVPRSAAQRRHALSQGGDRPDQAADRGAQGRGAADPLLSVGVMRRSIGILLAAGTLCLAAGAGAERVESVFDGGDPFVLVEGDKVWIYPTGGKGLESWSSTDLVHWRNHGPLLRKSEDR